MHYLVREFGYLGLHGTDRGLDYRRIGEDTFAQLCQLSLDTKEGQRELIRIRRFEGQECLQLVNYVGLLQTRNGAQIEILPKTSPSEDVAGFSRKLLWKMLRVVNDVSPQEAGAAALATLNDNWLEALTSFVLKESGLLIKKGIRNRYVRQGEESTFLKGQLRVADQMRARPGTTHKFAVSYDRFIPDRPENRLIKRCLLILNQRTRLLENKRLCREYLFMFDNVPASTNYEADLRRWRNNRNMIYYQPLLPWIRLILTNQAPVFSQGPQQGWSLLFPMEQLFESYVSKTLKRQLSRGYRLISQASSESLVRHDSDDWFRLKPDLMILYDNKRVAVLDTKWKRINASLGNRKDKYGISQADMYQLFAYGQKYLHGEGELFLIYPSHEGFGEFLPPFHFNEKLTLWVVAFDLLSSNILLPEQSELHIAFAKT